MEAIGVGPVVVSKMPLPGVACGIPERLDHLGDGEVLGRAGRG